MKEPLATGARTAGTRSGRPEPIVPEPGQESVWDYPRPPRVEPVPERLRVVVDGEILADTTGGMRVLETAGAPVYYFPPEDVRQRSSRRERPPIDVRVEGPGRISHVRRLERSSHRPGCMVVRGAEPGYEAIRGYLAFYAGRVDEAWVGEERATPQPGGFYGGWVTSKIVGPIKGEPGSFGW